VLYTDAPANGEADSVEPMDLVELEKRMATVLPDGWKLGQIKAEQPTTTYAEFKREILNEIARCLNMPFNVAACNSSSGYNYASGRLDHQTYFKSIRVEQAHCEAVARPHPRRLARRGASDRGLPPLAEGESSPHQWFWDGTEHVDPPRKPMPRPPAWPAHHHAGRRVRPPGQGLGNRTAPAGQGTGPHG
jgi:hypothetical protein